MSNVLHLKLTNLNETIVKCGFPVKTIDKYLQLLKNYNYKISIIDNISKSPLDIKDYITNTSMQDLLNILLSTNSEHLSIKEAYDLIDNLVLKAKEIKNQTNNTIL